MSTHKRHGMYHPSHIAYGKQLIVQKGQASETLGDFVRRVRAEKRLSLADVHARAKRAGHKIGTTHINRIENGFIEASSVTPKKLIALAAGLGVSEDEVFAVARGKSLAGESDFKKWKFASLFDEAEQLTPEQMAKFEILMEMARREVQRMLREQAEAVPPPKPKRMPKITRVIGATQEKEKKRA